MDGLGGVGAVDAPAPSAQVASTTTDSSASKQSKQEHQRQAAVDTLISTFINARAVLVHISDGRAFQGRFVCVDDGCNVILADADELRVDEEAVISRRRRQEQSLLGRQDQDDAGAQVDASCSRDMDAPEPTALEDDEDDALPYTSRWVGMVMIPGEHVRRVEVQRQQRVPDSNSDAQQAGRGEGIDAQDDEGGDPTSDWDPAGPPGGARPDDGAAPTRPRDRPSPFFDDGAIL